MVIGNYESAYAVGSLINGPTHSKALKVRIICDVATEKETSYCHMIATLYIHAYIVAGSHAQIQEG